MSGKCPVEQLHRRAERQYAGLLELFELERERAGERDVLAQLELALVGFEGVLVEAVEVLQEPSRSGQPAPVRWHGIRTGGGLVADRRLPVIGLDERGRGFLSS